MTRTARPQHDPADLAAAAETLQAAAARLLAQGVPEEDVAALAQAATAYAAEHAKADLTRPGTITAASPVFRGAMAAIGKVRAATLPLRTDCPGSGTTVSRWHSRQNPLDPMSEWTADPGPYTEGERVTCPRCHADVPVTPVADNRRSAGRQYVARLTAH